MLLDSYGLIFALLVDSDKHVLFGSQVDELGFGLVGDSHNFTPVFRPFNKSLVELSVVGDAAGGRLVVIIVCIEHGWGNEKLALLLSQVRIGRAPNLFQYINRISVVDGANGKPQEIAFICRDAATLHLGVGDCVEAIEKVDGLGSVILAHGIPNVPIETVTDFFARKFNTCRVMSVFFSPSPLVILLP